MILRSVVLFEDDGDGDDDDDDDAPFTPIVVLLFLIFFAMILVLYCTVYDILIRIDCNRSSMFNAWCRLDYVILYCMYLLV